jgi:UDP-3-O-acyl-N-acetylglucosamine deacetylase
MRSTVQPGVLSRKDIEVEFRYREQPGITLSLPNGSTIAPTVSYLRSATRNTVLGEGDCSVCFVEHLLAVANLLRLDHLDVRVSGPEIPLLDGSGAHWLEMLREWPHTLSPQSPVMTLSEPLQVRDGDKCLIAMPEDGLRLTYLFRSPVNGDRSWVSWRYSDGIEPLARSRTFASRVENRLLGMEDKALSFDETGFDLPLRYPEEPALHKLLDLFGDLSLCGRNPLDIGGHFLSLGGSHKLNTEMASKLEKQRTC